MLGSPTALTRWAGKWGPKPSLGVERDPRGSHVETPVRGVGGRLSQRVWITVARARWGPPAAQGPALPGVPGSGPEDLHYPQASWRRCWRSELHLEKLGARSWGGPLLGFISHVLSRLCGVHATCRGKWGRIPREPGEAGGATRPQLRSSLLLLRPLSPAEGTTAASVLWQAGQGLMQRPPSDRTPLHTTPHPPGPCRGRDDSIWGPKLTLSPEAVRAGGEVAGPWGWLRNSRAVTAPTQCLPCQDRF